MLCSLYRPRGCGEESWLLAVRVVVVGGKCLLRVQLHFLFFTCPFLQNYTSSCHHTLQPAAGFAEDWGGGHCIWKQKSTNFPKILEPPPNSTRQKGDMKEVPYWGPTNVKHHCTKLWLLRPWLVQHWRGMRVCNWYTSLRTGTSGGLFKKKRCI
jgi:hypothetical protein